MMRRGLGVFLTLLCCLTPSLAFAKAIEDVLLGADAQDIMITIVSDQPLNAPTVRAYSGSLRVRLYDAKETPLLKITGDGGAVKGVDVANGSDQSAAIVVSFTDKTRLNANDIRVEREGTRVVLRIARGLLPALHENAPAPKAAPTAPAKEAPAALPTLAVPAAPAKEAPKAVPVPVAKEAPKVVEPVVAKVPEPAKEEPAPVAEKKPTLGQPSPKPKAAKELKLAPSETGNTIPILIAVSAVLALCYGAIRLFLNKQSGVDIPAIDVIAQKRLGPRHQLVIVRAFDRDYLLSIQGGQTTVVARSSRGKTSGDREPTGLQALPFQRAPVGDLDLAPPSGSLRAPAKLPSAAPKPSISNTPKRPEPFEDDEVTFGGELFKAALEQRERQRDTTQANQRLEAARAEARAELARLESERDDYAAAVRPSLPASNVEEEELVEAPKAADAMMSDAVSGLLRLRKASGR